MKHQRDTLKEAQFQSSSCAALPLKGEKMTKSATAGCRILLLLAFVGFATAMLPTDATGQLDVEALARLKRARAQWRASGPDSYVMRLQRSCFCFGDFIGPFLVTVEDGVVADVRFAPGGPTGTPSPDVVNGIPTVGGLFDIIQEALDSRAEFVSVTYDSKTGAPLDFFIDRSRQIADEEIGYTIQFVDEEPDTKLEELNAARDLWQDTRPDSYAMRVSMSCFCARDFLEPFVQNVEGDTVVSLEYAPDASVLPGSPVPDGLELPTVDGLFAKIEAALQRGADTVDVSYNPNNGVPERVFINEVEGLLDAGVGYFVQLVEMPTPDGTLLEELNDARDRWEEYRAQSYKMQLTISCFCPAEFRGPFIVDVTGDTIVSKEFAPEAEVQPGTQVVADLITVDGVFNEIEEAIRASAFRIDASYNPVTGVPEEVFIDRDTLIADEEIGYALKLLQ